MERYSKYETLAFEKLDNNILKITMNLPDTLNAVNETMHHELSRVFYDVARDRNVDVVVLTGAGRAFSAGGDIKMLEDCAALGSEYMHVVQEGTDVVRSILQMPQPVIAMVNGPAVGLGCTVALYSDIIIASEKAKFADPHVKMGIVAGDGGAVIWPLLIGPAKAKEYLLTGKMLSAADAKEIGLINHVVAPEELESKTMELANELASGSRAAVQLTKRAVNMVVEQFSNQIVSASLAFEGLTFQGRDVHEAISAFKEKRPPKFK